LSALARSRRLTPLTLAALWLASAGLLAALTTHVKDWYVMTDELLYERLAVSIVQLHSPLPHVHGQLIANVNQLYPLLLAPLFGGQLVPDALREAHLLNAIVMSSACIPAFLLCIRVTRNVRAAYVVAALSVSIPWMVLSSFVMTETLAYPVFLWAMLALHHTLVAPSAGADVVLLVLLALATLSRTQFAILVFVVPVALLLESFAPREVVVRHRVLAFAYGVLAVTVLVLFAVGHLADVLGTYSVTAKGNLVPRDMPRSLLEHLAPLALGIGIVPFILGVAWLVTPLAGVRTREERAFASLAIVSLVALLGEVTSYDLRFGAGRLHDRYLFYVLPLLLIACAAACRERSLRRWTVVLAGALVAFAFSVLPIISYGKFNVDSPVAFLNDSLLDLGSERAGQLVLAALAIVVTLLLLAGRRVMIALVLLAIVGTVAQTAGAFTRLLTHDGTSGRPITLDQSVVFDWLDRTVRDGTQVTMIPYPLLPGTYWENVSYWWNVEFWNESVRRAIVYEDAFTGTPDTFPVTALAFDETTGRSNISPPGLVATAVAESRFHMAGKTIHEDRGVALVLPDRPWRADWVAFDLYRDGWTIPKVTGRIRVFAVPRQMTRQRRYVTITAQAPRDAAARPFSLSSNAGTWRENATSRPTSLQMSLCVPAGGFADIRVNAPRYSPIYGDPQSEASFVSYARSGGVLLSGVALADEVGSC
jgi:hypothetical protein